MKRTAYDIIKQPKGNTYCQLINCAIDYCDAFLFVPGELDDYGNAVIERLQPFLISRTEESEWPGTQILAGDKVMVYRFNLSPKTAAILCEVADRLFAWVSPYLPEDLCFLRADGTPWLITETSHKYAYFELSSEELLALKAKVPSLALTATPTDEELFVLRTSLTKIISLLFRALKHLDEREYLFNVFSWAMISIPGYSKPMSEKWAWDILSHLNWELNLYEPDPEIRVKDAECDGEGLFGDKRAEEELQITLIKLREGGIQIPDEEYKL